MVLSFDESLLFSSLPGSVGTTVDSYLYVATMSLDFKFLTSSSETYPFSRYSVSSELS